MALVKELARGVSVLKVEREEVEVPEAERCQLWPEAESPALGVPAGAAPEAEVAVGVRGMPAVATDGRRGDSRAGSAGGRSRGDGDRCLLGGVDGSRSGRSRVFRRESRRRGTTALFWPGRRARPGPLLFRPDSPLPPPRTPLMPRTSSGPISSQCYIDAELRFRHDFRLKGLTSDTRSVKVRELGNLVEILHLG